LLLVGSEALVELGRPGVGCGELGGMRVLTDPWFTDSAHYHHGEPLGIALTALPHLDAVVVSHCHYDQHDIDAFAAYADKRVPMIVAAGLSLGGWFDDDEITSVASHRSAAAWL
jgi:L-ascorbate metabolism protein UlaG (beta-lactamase superfamily)